MFNIMLIMRPLCLANHIIKIKWLFNDKNGNNGFSYFEITSTISVYTFLRDFNRGYVTLTFTILNTYMGKLHAEILDHSDGGPHVILL